MATNILASFLLFFLFTTSSSVHSLRILGLFPHPGLSHFHFFHPIMRALADAGHDVVVVSHFPDKNSPDNYEDLRLPMTEMLMNSVNLEVNHSIRPEIDNFPSNVLTIFSITFLYKTARFLRIECHCNILWKCLKLLNGVMKHVN